MSCNILPSDIEDSSQGIFSGLTFPTGQGLILRISIGVLALVLVLVSPEESIEIILSLSTIGLFISQISRGRRVFQSLGWSVVLLSIGLIIGGLILGGNELNSQHISAFSGDRLEAIPAVILLWLGALILG